MQKINYKKIAINTFVFTLLVFLPTISFAEDLYGYTRSIPPTPRTFKDIICIIVLLALDFIPFIFVIAIGAFLMGLIKYIGHGDNEEKRMEGTKMMIYGTLGLFFMVSVWGIQYIFANSFGLRVGIPQFKEIPTDGSSNKYCEGNSGATSQPSKNVFQDPPKSQNTGIYSAPSLYNSFDTTNSGLRFNENSLLTPGP